MAKRCYSLSRLCVILLTVVFVVQCAKRKKRNYNYSMRDTVEIGHIAKVPLPSEGDRIVDVVTVSDAAAGVRAFTVDDLLSGEECDQIISLSSGGSFEKSGVAREESSFMQAMRGSKQEQQRTFIEWDQNRDGHLSAKEVKKAVERNCDIVDLNYTDLLLRYVRVPQDSLQGYKMSSKDFAQVDWKGWLTDMTQNHPNRFSRHSNTAWFEYEAPVMQRLLKKVAAVTGLEENTVEANRESLQLLHYPAGGAHYSCHHDTSADETDRFRFLTFFIFLADVSEGGETVLFGADVNGSHPERRKWKQGKWERLEELCQSVESCPEHPGGTMPEKFRGAAVVKPKKGRILFWYNAEVDSKGRGVKFVWSSLHGGCPTLKEPKWAANVWLFAGPYLKKGQKPEL